MTNRTWYLPVLVLCLSCGGSKPPVEEPAATTSEETAPTNEETPSEPEAGESSEPAPASENGGSEKPEVKKKCEELDKSTCKVTVGCGWNDVKKCVSTAVSE